MIFFKIAAKNLVRSKSRAILTILAIALGCALLTGITILNESYQESYLNGVSDQLGYTDIGIKMHSNVKNGYFTLEELEDDVNFNDIDGYKSSTSRIVNKHILTNIPNQAEAQAHETTFFGIDIEDDDGFGYADILETINEVDDADSIEDVLEENPLYYCVITSWVEEVYNFKIGQEILVPHKSDDKTDFGNSSTWVKYRIAAIIKDYAEGWDIKYQDSIEESDRVHISRAIYFDINELRKMFNLGPEDINLVYIHCDLSKLNDYAEELDEELDDDFYWDNIKGGELENVYDTIRTTQLILIVFTVISFIIAGMLTGNTLMMSVNEQKYQTGVMRAQGIYRKEIFKIFFSEALILSSFGAALGIIMGVGLSPILTEYYFNSQPSSTSGTSFKLDLVLNPLSLLIIFGLVVSISLLIGILPSYFATKIQIIEAIQNISTEKKDKKLKKALFPLIGLILTIVGFIILTISHRNLYYTLIGIVPFILGLVVLSTVLIPLLSKGLSYVFSFFLKSLRKITEKNLQRNSNQTKITFIMFGLAIGFLVMVSNVLFSLQNIYQDAIPRYIGVDIIISSEGSTFGMDEVLLNDKDFIDGAIEEATLMNSMRVKADGYGKLEESRKIEPKVNLYIIEGSKFVNTINEVDMRETLDDLDDEEIFRKLDEQPNSAIVCNQLVDKDHLNKDIGDEIEIDADGFEFDVEIIGIAEFISGISETWQEPHDIKPAKTKGRYCIFVSWNTIKPYIDDIYDYLPESDLVLKGEDHDTDYWDFPTINRTYVRNIVNTYAKTNGIQDKINISEIIWSEGNQTSISGDSINSFYELNNTNSMVVNTAFENITLRGTTEFYKKRHNSFKTVSDALKNGTKQYIITYDVYLKLNLGIDDNISIWYDGMEGLSRANFTIAGIIMMNSTIEAVNFHSENPYIPGNYDVGADDTKAVIIDISTMKNATTSLLEDILGSDNQVFEFLIDLQDYYDDHVRVLSDLQKLFGLDYVIADMRWILTREYSYAPIWLLQVNEDDFDQEEALERVKEFLLFHNMPAIYWKTSDELEEQYADQINFQKSFFNIILGFALIIAVLGIIIHMLIAIANRKRELGMMRAIGIYKRELIKMILGETLMLVFAGFLIGLIIGLFSAQLLLLGLPLDIVFDLKLYIDYWTIFILFGIVIIISIIAAAIPSVKILRLNVIDSLRTN